MRPRRRREPSPLIKDYRPVPDRLLVLSYKILFLVWLVYFLLHVLMPGPTQSLAVSISYWVPGIEEMVKGRDTSGTIRVLVVTILLIMPFLLVHFVRTMIPRIQRESLEVRVLLKRFWKAFLGNLFMWWLFLTAWIYLLRLPGEEQAEMGSTSLLLSQFFQNDLFSGAYLLLGAFGSMQGVAFLFVFSRELFFALTKR